MSKQGLKRALCWKANEKLKREGKRTVRNAWHKRTLLHNTEVFGTIDTSEAGECCTKNASESSRKANGRMQLDRSKKEQVTL